MLISDLGGDDSADGLAARPSGSIVVAGSSADEMMAAQYGPDGTLTRALAPPGSSASAAMPEGSALATGSVGFNSALVRYTPCG